MLSIRLLEQSYARELARVLEKPVSVVQKALLSLEKDGLISGRSMGRTRVFSLNPRYFARRELLAFLDRLAQSEDRLKRTLATLRKRPRRTGKRL